MKALYWNVCSEAPKNEIVENAIDLIEGQQIDIACLSEVPYATQPGSSGVHIPLSSIIALELGMEPIFEHTRTIGQRTDTNLRGYGTAIISKSDILKVDRYTLREDRFAYMTPGEGNKRSFLGVIVEENPDIEIATAHLSYPIPLPGALRGLSAERTHLFKLLEEKATDGSLIYGGDMNVRPNGALDTLIESAGLSSAGDTSEPTFRSRHWYAGHTRRNLDRVYATPDLDVQVTVGDRQHSDHHPLIVEIN